jgi:DME family drug/metabolite transporter
VSQPSVLHVDGSSDRRVPRSALLLLASCVLSGTSGTAATLGLVAAPPLALGGVRMAVGAAVFFVVLPAVGGNRRRTLALVRRPGTWLVALGSAGFQPCFFAATRDTGVAVATLVAMGSAPVIAGVLGWIALGHRPAPAWAAATATAIAGLVLLSRDDLTLDGAAGGAWALGAGACLAGYIVAVKAGARHGGSIVEVASAAYLIGAILLVPLVVAEGAAWIASPRDVAVLLYLGAVTMAGANLLHVRGVGGLAPGPAATMTLADPLTATLLGTVLLSEPMSAQALVGAMLLLGSLAGQGCALRLRGRGARDVAGRAA